MSLKIVLHVAPFLFAYPVSYVYLSIVFPKPLHMTDDLPLSTSPPQAQRVALSPQTPPVFKSLHSHLSL